MSVKKKISRKDLISLNNIIENLLEKSTQPIPFGFSYCLSKNSSKIESEIIAIKSANKVIDNKELSEKEQEILLKYCLKDSDNKPLIENSQYQFDLETYKIVKKELEDLKNNYPEILKFEEFMEENVEIDFYTIPMSEEIGKLSVSPFGVKILSKYMID